MWRFTRKLVSFFFLNKQIYDKLFCNIIKINTTVYLKKSLDIFGMR